MEGTEGTEGRGWRGGEGMEGRGWRGGNHIGVLKGENRA